MYNMESRHQVYLLVAPLLSSLPLPCYFHCLCIRTQTARALIKEGWACCLYRAISTVCAFVLKFPGCWSRRAGHAARHGCGPWPEQHLLDHCSCRSRLLQSCVWLCTWGVLCVVLCVCVCVCVFKWSVPLYRVVICLQLGSVCSFQFPVVTTCGETGASSKAVLSKMCLKLALWSVYACCLSLGTFKAVLISVQEVAGLTHTHTHIYTHTHTHTHKH
jgi:hypothetical protein